MPLFTAEQLDLSRLPAFQLVTVDEEAERLALIAGIEARFAARGIPFSVGMLRTDHVVVLAEEVAFRKTLDLQALNDAGKRLSLTYGYGEALDQMAAAYFADLGLRRLVLVPADPATGTPAVMESDARFKLRLSLAPEARTFGTLGGYEYLALTAAPFLIDALALNYSSGLCAPGEIVLIGLGRDPDPDPSTAKPAQEEPAQLALVQTVLLDRDRGRSTDTVSLRAARRVTVDRSYILGIRRGPDVNLVKGAARVAYATFTERTRPADLSVDYQRSIGKLLAESAEKAALKVGGVEYVHPGAAGSGIDVDPGPDGVVTVSNLALATEMSGG